MMVQFDPIEDHSFKLTLTEFILKCVSGELTRGFGELATSTHQAWNRRIYPHDAPHMTRSGIPLWATHVVWYGR